MNKTIINLVLGFLITFFLFYFLYAYDKSSILFLIDIPVVIVYVMCYFRYNIKHIKLLYNIILCFLVALTLFWIGYVTFSVIMGIGYYDYDIGSFGMVMWLVFPILGIDIVDNIFNIKTKKFKNINLKLTMLTYIVMLMIIVKFIYLFKIYGVNISYEYLFQNSLYILVMNVVCFLNKFLFNYKM